MAIMVRNLLKLAKGGWTGLPIHETFIGKTMECQQPSCALQGYEETPSWDEITKHYKDLLDIDRVYSGLVRKLLYAFLQYCVAKLKKSEVIRQLVQDPKTIIISGSCSDGSGTCRWFRHGITDLEMDIMFQIGNIGEDIQDELLIFSPEKPGFAQIRRCSATFEVLHPYLKSRYDQYASVLNLGEPGAEFVDTVLVKETCGSKVGFVDSDGFLTEILSSSLNINKSVFDMSLHEGIEGPSFLSEITISQGGEQNYLFSTDKVIALKLEKWPEQMDQWRNRTRNWPNQDTIDACVKQGCHLVPKKSSTESEVNTEWRFSFSVIEGLLMKSWNEHQQLTYYFLKSLFYRHLRGIERDGIHVPSYVLKSEMFWAMEECCVSEWTSSNLKDNALRVLQRLDRDLQAGFVANYFIPSMNLIDPRICPHDLIQGVHTRLAEVLAELQEAVPKDLEKVKELARNVFPVLDTFLQLFELMTVQLDLKAQHRHKVEELTPEPLD